MSSTELFQELEAYDWDADQEFQLGLKGILDSSQPTSDDQKNDLTIRARCFYFARKFGKQVDFDAYKASKQAPTAKTEDDEKTLSYAALVEMIQSGKPIPGIKDIPDTVLEGQGTQPAASQRRKPWEKDTSDTPATVAPEEQQIAA